MIPTLIRSFTTWPDLTGWTRCALISAAGLAVIALLAFAGGFAHWQPRLDTWPLRLLSVMIVPALTEEAVFRGLLVPDKDESRHPALWIGLGTIAFVLWHVIEAETFLPGATLFLTPAFLAAAGVLGFSCALMRYRTGSLWPCVLLHGFTVFVWQIFLSGPDVRSLL